MNRPNAYSAAVVASSVGGLALIALFGQLLSGIPIRIMRDVMSPPFIVTLAATIAIAGLFHTLSRRPRAWGKYICLIGIAPIVFTTSALNSWTASISNLNQILLVVPGLSGGVLMLVFIALIVEAAWPKVSRMHRSV